MRLIQENQIDTTLEFHKWLKRAERIYEDTLLNLKELNYAPNQREYRPYQPYFAALYCTRKFNICGGGCGLGKTIISGLVAASLYQDNWGRRGQIHIGAPNRLSLTERWSVDLAKIPALEGKISVIHEPKQLENASGNIWIYPLDFLKRQLGQLGQSTVLKYLTEEYPPEFIIVDEVDLLQPGSLRTKCWERLRKVCERVLTLSGTFTDHRLELLFNVCKFTYGDYFPYTWGKFKEEFGATSKITTNYIGGEEKISETSTRYLDHLSVVKAPKYYQLMTRFVHRPNLSDPDVLPYVSYPKSNLIEIKTLPHPDHRKEYRLTVNKYRGVLENAISRGTKIGAASLGLVSPLIKMSNGFELKDIPNKKLERLMELIDPTEKTAIFTGYIDTGRILTEVLSQRLGEKRVIRLYAEDTLAIPKKLNANSRAERVSRFLFEDKVACGIFSINLAGVSIDLNSAKRVIFYDLPWQWSKVHQAMARAIRPGNLNEEVEVIFLYNQGMICQHQFSLLKLKRAASNLMTDFDATESMGIDSSSINLSELIKLSLNFPEEGGLLCET